MLKKIEIEQAAVDIGEGRLLPKLFEPGSGMRRFVTAPDLSYRAGYTKIENGQGIKSFYWYDEFWIVMDGTAKLTGTDRATGETVVLDLKPRDYVFMGAGTHFTCEVKDGPLLFVYIAIPASSKDAPWLANMTQEDIEDIRIRQEYSRVDGRPPEGVPEPFRTR